MTNVLLVFCISSSQYVLVSAHLATLHGARSAINKILTNSIEYAPLIVSAGGIHNNRENKWLQEQLYLNSLPPGFHGVGTRIFDQSHTADARRQSAAFIYYTNV